ncbi:YafY family protein [Streptomyces sp. ST2-7A]|uniref:helix-turn-helix transcriptional regulator n=1 Tax=Streptomyces sp. ST2-7A TaxID=2907214 RepID=UPI001F2E0455|nr:WYL domain-containing protein [Streptomyces sp. ST2-7A]MCE7081544.1 WYL domain-containing protein [Streptomyces sp. ST2-7A]
MRAARLIHLVLLLQQRHRMTAAELAAELEVSERTVARDVTALAEAGIPVLAERGRAGGYSLVAGYRTRLTGLDGREAAALLLSAVPAAVRDLGLDGAAGPARLKLAAALGPEAADLGRRTAERFHLDAPDWWRSAPTPPLLSVLAGAVRDDLRLSCRYRRGDGEVVERPLEPHGLVLKAGVWYLVARPAGSGTDDHRTYRAERFLAAEPTGARFERDPGLDLAALWERRAVEFARSLLRETVVVRLTEAGARRLPHVTDRRAAEEALASAEPPDPTGRRTVVLAVESVEVAADQVLRLGPEAEALAPPGFRARLTDLLHRAAALYPPPDRVAPPPPDPVAPPPPDPAL